VMYFLVADLRGEKKKDNRITFAREGGREKKKGGGHHFLTRCSAGEKGKKESSGIGRMYVAREKKHRFARSCGDTREGKKSAELMEKGGMPETHLSDHRVGRG